jgi:hypothetical protein
MAEREPAPADPGDPATEDMELLTGHGLGGVREEGEVDLRHPGRWYAARPVSGLC